MTVAPTRDDRIWHIADAHPSGRSSVFPSSTDA